MKDAAKQLVAEIAALEEAMRLRDGADRRARKAAEQAQRERATADRLIALQNERIAQLARQQCECLRDRRQGKRVCPECKALVVAYARRTSRPEAARVFGVSEYAVGCWCSERGLPQSLQARGSRSPPERSE